MLAIVWALQHLRNYLYGIADVTIFTDHRPLIFSVSDKNPSLKIQRWKAFTEESGARIQYKPGSQNVVADTLSRQFNHLSEESSLESDHSTPNSPENDGILRKNLPLNFFKTQIHLKKSHIDELKTSLPFKGYTLHTIRLTNSDSLLRNLALIIHHKGTNIIHSTEEEFYSTITNTAVIKSTSQIWLSSPKITVEPRRPIPILNTLSRKITTLTSLQLVAPSYTKIHFVYDRLLIEDD